MNKKERVPDSKESPDRDSLPVTKKPLTRVVTFGGPVYFFECVERIAVIHDQLVLLGEQKQAVEHAVVRHSQVIINVNEAICFASRWPRR